MRRAYLDGMRALAACYVVVYHSFILYVLPWLSPHDADKYTILTYGHLAVAVFITLSGYCLSLSSSSHSKGAVDFFKRRARRLLPPYFAALAITLVFSFPSITTAIAHVFLVQNLSSAWSMKANYPLWSIATEWQIYLFFPLLILMRRRSGALSCVILSLLISFSLIAVSPVVGIWLGASFWFVALFALGLCLSDIPAERAARLWKPVAGVCLGILLATEVFFSTGATYGSWGRVALRDLLAALITVSLIAGCEGAPLGRLRRILEWRPLPIVGVFSYSLYLIHAPVLAAIHALGGSIWFGLPVSLAVAYLFFLMFERPFLKKKLVAASPLPRAEEGVAL